jgi:hypothetical protein
MNTVESQFLPEKELIDKALQILTASLGPIETTRFLNLSRQQNLDSVSYHRQWQEQLDENSFFEQLVIETEKMKNANQLI